MGMLSVSYMGFNPRCSAPTLNCTIIALDWSLSSENQLGDTMGLNEEVTRYTTMTITL